MRITSPTDRVAQWIGGEWSSSSGEGFISVTDPSTEQVIGEVPAGSVDDVDRAVAAATKAFPRWSTTRLPLRLALIERLLARIEAMADEFADIVSTEVGAPAGLARGVHVGLALDIVRSYLDLAARHSFEERIASTLVVREPIGVVGCITPWNVPLIMNVQKVVPALAMGCTVVLKPSEITPLNAFLLAEAIAECDLPAGVFNLVSGEGPTVGEALASHPDVAMISFTGSTRAGRRVAQLAAQTVKRVQLELGGKSANIILDDADLASAVRAGVSQVCLNTGQTCLAWSRMFVSRESHDDAAALAREVAGGHRVGDPRDPATEMGPLVSSAALSRVRGYINRGVEEGATLVAGGAERPIGLDRGYYVRPTVFADVRNEMTIAREEIFGPVLSIIPYDSTDDAVRMANDSIYGLHGAVWSGNEDRALDVARRLRTGQVNINCLSLSVVAPFGGYKQSGIGRELGTQGLDGFLELKAVQLAGEEAAQLAPAQ
jgi:aldehyde dehydrogenase (NAD+)